MVDVARSRFESDRIRSIPAVGPTLESATTEVLEQIKGYAREKPVTFACWAFGIGFVLGWRLKPW